MTKGDMNKTVLCFFCIMSSYISFILFMENHVEAANFFIYDVEFYLSCFLWPLLFGAPSVPCEMFFVLLELILI